MSPDSLLLVQLTDTHLFADEAAMMMGIKTAASFQAILGKLAQLPRRPDALLLTGDLSQDETPASYERLRRAIAPLQIPTYTIPGNHDIRELMAATLRGQPFQPARSLQLGGWHVILLDSVVEGQTAGELADTELAFLAEQLAAFPNLPTLIALHHPPCLIDSPWMDEIGLHRAEDFYAILDSFPQVKGVLFGHIHQAFEGDRQGVRYFGTPSACVQFQPRSRSMAIDETWPGFRLVELFANGRLETNVVRVPFHETMPKAG